MQIKVVKRKMDIPEAQTIADGKGGYLGKLVVRNSVSQIDIAYFPYYLIDFSYVVQPGRIGKLIDKNAQRRESKISILTDCTTASSALVEKMPDMEELEVAPDCLKEKLLPENEIVDTAKKLAFRLLRKFIVGSPEIMLAHVEEVYRPFWVAIYGEYKEGNKVRYMPIPADGFKFKRT